ncbi:PQQ-dependent sugar dehydrogenase [Saccharopolyspora indica]|uniref:PQQ-dependent sugar dehydrogenase n=1 Tax=Saccharopolyspora indica TaxID=1229659 RepID=UPI0022EB2853|nr:PQQ-dependent sugar dehydrogenase [Saccharopolyspora indica]MDA3647678.1 PQQ-dependent sugar dehydrogenase [Saccharopolyspora indica]
MSLRKSVTAVALTVAATVTGGPVAAGTTGTAAPPAGAEPRPVVGDFDVLWGVAVLPDRSTLVTERDSGRVLRVVGKTVTEVARIPLGPPIVEDPELPYEGGLLGIAVSPRYDQDETVYVYYSGETDNRIAKLKPGEQPQPIVTGIPRGQFHNGGRLEIGPDGMLYAGTGDGTVPENAQDPASLGGKILRMDLDGRPAPGNPVADSLVYSSGHRNVQGFAWDDSGRMFASELGDVVDELNGIAPGADYGWPTCEGACQDDRYTNPLIAWDHLEASPSGVAFHDGHLYVAALRGERMWKIPVDDNGNVGQGEALFAGTYGRLRTVLRSPDGGLWFTTSNKDNPWGEPRPGDDQILSFRG